MESGTSKDTSRAISKSNSSENDADCDLLHIFDVNPSFISQIRKFRRLITTELHFEDEPEEALEVKIQNQIIRGVIKKFMNKIESVPHMPSLFVSIGKLSDIFEHDMGKPTGDKYVHTDKLKSYYQITRTRQRRLNDMAEERDAKQLEHQKFKREKINHINRTLDKMRYAREQLEQDISNLVHSYAQNTTAITNAANARINSLREDHEELSKKFYVTAKLHKAEETTLKDRKHTLDQQLAQWIEKYDQDIGSRETELQQIIEKFETASAEYRDLETAIGEYEIIYNHSVLERTTEEKRIFDAKLQALMYARAAKTLQRSWRAHRAQQKRKKRKGGKRKQK